MEQTKYDIFISYKVNTSQNEACKLYDILREKGYSVFLDKEKLQGGKEWNPQLEDALSNAKCCFVFTTPESINAFQEGWNDINSNSYSYYCKEIKLITDRLTDNTVENRRLCIPLFTESLETLRKNNKYFLQDTIAKKCIDKLIEVQGYEYTPIKGHLTFSNELIDTLCKQLSNGGIYPFGKKGKSISAKEFFYDENRASEAQGYMDDRQYYVERDIDDTIRDFANSSNRGSILVITGRPGTGKTRSVYEWIRREMAEENIVVLRTRNIKTIYDSYQKQTSTRSQCIYFVCDQVHDVLGQLGTDQQKNFFNTIYSCQCDKFIGTDTPLEFEKWCEGIYLDNDLFYKKKRSFIIGDLTTEERKAFQSNYGISSEDAEKCHIAADFIKPLRAHKDKIINAIISANKYNTQTKGIVLLLKSIQLCKLIKGDIVLEYMLPIIKATEPDLYNNKSIIECLNFLSKEEEGLNLIDLDLDGKTELTMFDYPIEYANDIVINIHDDLAWEMMQDKTMGKGILFNLYSIDDTNSVCKVIGEAYGTPQVFCKLLYELPWKSKQEDDKDYSDRCEKIRECAKKRIDKWMKTGDWDTQNRDYRNVVSALVERSLSVEQITTVFDRYQISTDAKAIRSLYRIAKHWHLKLNDEKQFVGFQELLKEKTEEYHNLKNHTVDDISYIYNEIVSDYDKVSFDKAYKQTELCFNSDFIIDGKVQTDIDYLLTALAHLCKQAEDFSKLWKLMDMISSRDYFMSIYTAQAISKAISDIYYHGNAKEEEFALLSLLIDRIPNHDSLSGSNKETNTYLSYVARIVNPQRCFMTAKYVYETARHELGMDTKNEHEPRIISMCLNKCQKNEFPMIISYVNNLQLKDKGIAYNILVSKAPTLDDAYYVLKLMSEDNIDSYTLSNCLRKVESYKYPSFNKIKKELQRSGDPRFTGEEILWLDNNAKEQDKIIIDYAYDKLNRLPRPQKEPWQKALLEFLRSKERFNFLNVYELMNHPKFERIRQSIDPPCINIIYKLVQNEDQELYVHRLISPTTHDWTLTKLPSHVINEQIMPTLISKRYRSIGNAFAIYNLFGNRKLNFTQTGIYNALFSKYAQEDTTKYPDEERKELEDNMKKLESDVSKALEKRQVLEDILLFCNRRRWLIKSNEITNKEDGEFIFKPNATEFTEAYFEVLRHEKPKKRSQEDIRKLFITTIRGIKDCYDYATIERSIKTYEHFSNYYGLKWHSSIKHFLKQMFPNDKQIYDFIIDNQPQQKDDNPKRPRNDYKDITIEQVLNEFREIIETNSNGYVSPATINYYLSIYIDKIDKLKNIRKKNSYREKVYTQTAQLLEQYELLDYFTSMGYELMASLAPKEKKKEWLDLFDKSNGDLSEKALGSLAVNGAINITRSREYFNHWLNCFEDIYESPEHIAHNLSSEKMDTLGRRLRMELSQQFKDEESSSIIKKILIIYSYSQTAFSEDNFTNITIEELMSYIEEGQRPQVYSRITELEGMRILGEKAIDESTPHAISRKSFKEWMKCLIEKYGTMQTIARMIGKTEWMILYKRIKLEEKMLNDLLKENTNILSFEYDDVSMDTKIIKIIRNNQENLYCDIAESIVTMEDVITIYSETKGLPIMGDTPLSSLKKELKKTNPQINLKNVNLYLQTIINEIKKIHQL